MLFSNHLDYFLKSGNQKLFYARIFSNCAFAWNFRPQWNLAVYSQSLVSLEFSKHFWWAAVVSFSSLFGILFGTESFLLAVFLSSILLCKFKLFWKTRSRKFYISSFKTCFSGRLLPGVRRSNAYSTTSQLQKTAEQPIFPFPYFFASYLRLKREYWTIFPAVFWNLIYLETFDRI